jgi:hypothetical protein
LRRTTLRIAGSNPTSPRWREVNGISGDIENLVKEEERAAANSRPWLYGREFFCLAFFEQKPASNLVPKRTAVRCCKKRVV